MEEKMSLVAYNQGVRDAKRGIYGYNPYGPGEYHDSYEAGQDSVYYAEREAEREPSPWEFENRPEFAKYRQ